MAGEEIWLIENREKYELICSPNKNTVSTINLTFWHQNETCEITKFILRGASRPSFFQFFSLGRYEGWIFSPPAWVPGLEKGCWLAPSPWLGWTPPPRGEGWGPP